jgi:hypothetical protein
MRENIIFSFIYFILLFNEDLQKEEIFDCDL